MPESRHFFKTGDKVTNRISKRTYTVAFAYTQNWTPYYCLEAPAGWRMQMREDQLLLPGKPGGYSPKTTTLEFNVYIYLNLEIL